MKKLLVLFMVLSLSFLLTGCLFNGNKTDTDKITYKTQDYIGKTEQEFFAYRDGKDGEWKKAELNADGSYDFEVNSEDGNYSIVNVRSYVSNNEKKYTTEIFNLNKSDGQIIYDSYSDGYISEESENATITINMDNDFLFKNVGVITINRRSESSSKIFNIYDTNNLSEKLSVVAGNYYIMFFTNDKNGFDKIYLERNVNLYDGKEINLKYSDFKDYETFTVSSSLTTGTSLNDSILLSGIFFKDRYFINEHNIYGSAETLKIPKELSSEEDFYLLVISGYEETEYGCKCYSTYKVKKYPDDVERIDKLPSDDFNVPEKDGKKIKWEKYDPKLTGQSLRAYQMYYNNNYENSSVSNYIFISDKWLGESESYEYTIPDLSDIEGFNSEWFGETESYEFKCVSGNSSNISDYISLPFENSLELSVFEHRIYEKNYEEETF